MRRNQLSSVKACDLRFLPRCILDLQIIIKSKRSNGEIKYIPRWMGLLFVIGVSSSLFFVQRRPTSPNSSNDALCFWPLRLVLSAMYHFDCCLWDPTSLIRVMQQLIWRVHCSGPLPWLLIMLMDWAISQRCSPTLLSIQSVVKPP